MIVPQKNCFVVVDVSTGQHLMHVIDAHNMDDPAWNPEGSAHIHIPIHKYITMRHEDLHDHVNEQISLIKEIR